ncbi:peptidoglycan DD-metalloendopeptidase family protein [Kocuria carniphila]|uniref:peptidoglycan DD-metalloendopeptidase family protein n=1 Tax=Kocuria carniphila TaxID=262208 RepID=UPI0034DADAF5
MARSRARHTAAKRPSMALTAFASFSALVAVSVALSNGSVPAPWESAYANESSGESSENPQNRGTFGQPQADEQGESRPSLFAAVPDDALISDVQDTPQDYVASQVHNVSDRGTGSAPSSVAPAKRAPATFEGELPFNTIIAPAQPPTVLDGGQFGWRVAPDTKEREFHNGTDISTSEGTPVVAALEGTVTAVFWDEWGGNRVEVSHADGVKTTYNHLKDVMVQVGDPLKASEQLGTIGQTGLRVTGPHLHFETWVEGKAVDAQSFDWETGEGIIPASRPKYSLEDQAQTDQATTDNGSVPGTDNGPMSDVPEDEQERIIALSRETAPAEDVPAESSVSDSGDGDGAGAGSGDGAGAGAEPGPVAERRAAEAQPSQSREPEDSATQSHSARPDQSGGSQSPSTESRSARPSPSRSSSSSNDDAEGRVNAGSPSGATSNATKSRLSSGTSQGSGSGASSNTSEKDNGKKPDPTKKPKPSQPATTSEPSEPASTGDPVKPAPANTGKSKPQPTPTETGKPKPQPVPTETGKPKPQPTPTDTGKPKPQPTPTDTKKPAPVEPTKPAEPTQPADPPKAPKPETTKPAVPGAPVEPGTPPEDPKGDTPSNDKPAKPTVNPYEADITTLTTLEQLQQRTQVFVNQQLRLTPEQQFGTGSQLNAQLPLLSQQLVTVKVDQQDPKFTAQLTATQEAVEKAAAAPKDKKLTDAAIVELTKLQTMLAKVPTYVDPASSPAR